MIPSIEEILAGLLAGHYTRDQATNWIYAHLDVAVSGEERRSVRLQLAGFAMQGLLAKNGMCHPKDAYEMADAMLDAEEA